MRRRDFPLADHIRSSLESDIEALVTRLLGLVRSTPDLVDVRQQSAMAAIRCLREANNHVAASIVAIKEC